jgi:undecaprenyl-diphosphatase
VTIRRVSAILALVFVVVAVWVVLGETLPGDRWALTSLDGLGSSSIDEPMIAIGDVTDTLALSIVVVVVAGVLVLRGRWQDSVWFLVATVVVLAANPVLKEIFGRPRPDIRPWPEAVSPLSFPSGHAAGTAALVGALVMVTEGRRLRRAIILLGAALLGLVAFSRMTTAVHYPSDIVAGWAWAGAWVALVWAVMRRPRQCR